MPGFSLGDRSWCVTHAFGRNPLLRWTDRIEAWVIVFAIVAVLAATVVCAVAGAGVYRSHRALYAAQSVARQSVTATVVETDPPPHTPHATSTAVLVMWLVGADGARGGGGQGGDTARVRPNPAGKTGEPTAILV